MSAFRVGQKVVCVDDGGFMGQFSYPELRAVYTIRQVFWLFGLRVRLVEIRNTRGIWIKCPVVMCEPFFAASKFRPVQTTSIEWAHKLVADLPKFKGRVKVEP